ncbi:hypothetical protein D9611_010576 [Ephemerocybe angulata]|uniref:Uncharacterized protein n=1 Tax=Ephemerocybe angulata TaxID=980116 RepID=A0A8H5BV81_9AGAR|nr:hypothetical protein D9611_010576 [Tulosesus angulatus]
MSDHDVAPESTLPYPPIHEDKRFVVLSDWDGTITTHDSNDYPRIVLGRVVWTDAGAFVLVVLVLMDRTVLTDNLGYGFEKRREGNFEILADRVTFRRVLKDSEAERT